MTTSDQETFDLIGVGFGPSNLSLAVALSEAQTPIRAKFLEAQPQFAWHPGMMIPGADMQISFLKDLVGQRNPQSPYTFVSYLHQKGRLNRFINRKTFFPSRVEFNDYLCWVAAQFPVCDYDRRVVGIEAVDHRGTVDAIDVITREASGQETRYRARNLVIAPGGAPKLPAYCSDFADDPRVIHSKDYMTSVVPSLCKGERIAIIGAGQSAAEIFADLADRPEAPKLDLIMRGRTIKPSDDSPFVNEIFDPSQTDAFYALPENARHAALDELAATNYSVVDEDVINAIYEMVYEQSVIAGKRLSIQPDTQVTGLAVAGDALELTMSSAGQLRTEHYDRIICATGYTRALDQDILHGIAKYCLKAEPGRDYRLPMADGFSPSIYVQGYSEATHGLSDTLLSVLAQRSEEIVATLAAAPAHAREIAAE
ncbi:MAG: SidA/IucD/PvdA family monooxygenase [Sulfitobacter sp.]|nr:SidA/IucD/PvdA family monooxygenase [Sulfitobacter sp.]